MTKQYFFIFLVFQFIIQTLGIRQRSYGTHTQHSFFSNNECGPAEQVLKTLLQQFPCLQQHCQIDNLSPEGTLPTVQPTAPVNTTPIPTSSPTVVPEVTTTTIRPTIEAPPLPDDQVTEGHYGTYVPNWFVYRKHYMGVEKINVFHQWVSPESGSNDYQYFGVHMRPIAAKLTHVYYAFWDLSPDCIVQDVDPDASWYGKVEEPFWINLPLNACRGLMNDLMALKSEFRHLKLMISVGGWTFSGNFSKCTSTAQNRAIMYKTLFFYLNQMDTSWGTQNGIWDGADMDWEFPEAAGLTHNFAPNDWDNYVSLFQEMRAAAAAQGRNHAVFASAIGVGETLTRLIAKPAVARGFCEAVDYVNLMEYDIHGKWDSTTGHNAPFCIQQHAANPSQPLSVRHTIEAFASAGCPLNKMVLGIPNYSHAWSRIPPGPLGTGLFSTAEQNPFTGWSTFSDLDNALYPQGILSYWDLIEVLQKHSDFRVHTHMCPADLGITIPIRHVYSEQRRVFASYEDIETAELKSQWARLKGMRGIFFWDAQQDRFGHILDAARTGFGTKSTNPASGTRRCFDDHKIDFSLDPITGERRVVLCQFTNHSIQFNNGDTCHLLRQQAHQTCGSRDSQVIGGHRQGSNECIHICSADWDQGSVGPWVGDTVYFACMGEEIPDVGDGDGNPPGGGGSGGGNVNLSDCRGCDRCRAVPNNVQRATDAHCEPCAQGRQAWWPCNLGTTLCTCA